MMSTEERTKMTHYVPEALKRRAKLVAAARGETVTDLLIRALGKELDELEGPERETEAFIARHTEEGA
jgi:hypothetical protein